MGGGLIFRSGPSFARVRYMLTVHVIMIQGVVFMKTIKHDMKIITVYDDCGT